MRSGTCRQNGWRCGKEVIKKMNYYKLMYDYENEKSMAYVNIDEQSLGFNQYEINSNVNLKVKKIYCKVCAGDVTKYDYIPNNLAWPIVSEKIKIIIEKTELETYEFIQIVNENNERLIGYLLHCMNFVNALDDKKSLCKKFEYVSNGKKYERLSVIKYALLGEKIKGLDLFKLEESTVPLFVSEKLRNNIVESGATGFDFLKVEIS